MEEVFQNIKHYLEHRFATDISATGSNIDLINLVKDLHLTNLKTIIDVAAVFDANQFTTEATFLEASELLESSYLDFKSLFPLIDFENYDKDAIEALPV